jgi:hypothetical protein
LHEFYSLFLFSLHDYVETYVYYVSRLSFQQFFSTKTKVLNDIPAFCVTDRAHLADLVIVDLEILIKHKKIKKYLFKKNEKNIIIMFSYV